MNSEQRALLERVKAATPEETAASQVKADAVLRASAARAFDALAALDPNHREREELRAEGVAQSSIAALYPLTFAALAPRLIAHLSAHPPHSILRQSMIDMREHAELAFWGLPQALVDEWRTTRPTLDKPVAPELAELEACLRKLLDDPADGDLIQSRSALIIMWHAWWLSSHWHEFRDSAQRPIDGLMCWVAQHLLPGLTSRASDV